MHGSLPRYDARAARPLGRTGDLFYGADTGRGNGVASGPAPVRIARLKPTDLAFNRALGVRDAPPGAEHLLELPFGPLVQNHVGTVHAAAQFALAEAAAAERLRRDYAAAAGQALVLVRAVSAKYRTAATGDLLAYARPDDDTRQHLLRDLATRSRTKAVVLVELRDRAGTLCFAGTFEWFVATASPPSA